MGPALVPSGKSLLLSLKNVYETLSISVPTVVEGVRGTISKDVCDARIEGWASRVIANAEMMISVTGREHIQPGWLGHGPNAYLVMSNHQSHYDIAVIYYVLGAKIRMVAKRELFEVPIFGTAMRAAGFISVDRGNSQSAIASLEEARQALQSGTPIWIAPEGTRSPTGELMPFKKGGFVIAVDTGTPVLPVSIAGTREVLPAHGRRSRSGVEVFVTIHPPVDPKRWADKEPKQARDALLAEVRTAIASGL
jgi:1-acyl-sn-glycerol-3-phosphate acyltransferase